VCLSHPHCRLEELGKFMDIRRRGFVLWMDSELGWGSGDGGIYPAASLWT
jgi:hypothetical protein